jgi:spermidine/putrescine transport system ATP-binding protein
LFSLLGPSGCGKSTILKMIAGFEEPNAGEILVSGRSVIGMPPERRNIGFVFQNYALFPHMTVEENVGFGLEARGWEKRKTRQRVAEMLSLVELEGLVRRRPSQLSGGQQQRVALARALAIGPDVLLLDEPFGALDRRLRQSMQMKVLELQRKLGVTTIFVTHDQEEALTMSDRIAVMSVERHGFEQIGSPREIYERPASARVSTFIGETNLWDDTVVSVADGMAITGQGMRVAEVSTLAVGTRVVLSLRPERIILLRPGEGPPDNAQVLEGQVRDTIFVGDLILCLFESETGLSLRIKQLNGDRRHVFQRGERVRAAWQSHSLRALPATANIEEINS